MDTKLLFLLFAAVIIATVINVGKSKKMSDTTGPGKNRKISGIGNNRRISGQNRRISGLVHNRKISKKGKPVTLKSLKLEIEELRELIEALPKNVVNLHMHGHGDETSHSHHLHTAFASNITGDDESLEDEHKEGHDDATIHVHMQLDKHDDACSREEEVEIHAHCEVGPNQNLPDGDDINGRIHLIQKGDNPVDMHINLSGFDMTKEPMVHSHGFHIHHYGDLSNSCDSLGGHFNPVGVKHGARKSEHSHVGDLGNIECDMKGEIDTQMFVDKISLRGENSLIGRSIVIHAGPDDLGLGGTPGSHKSGNAGGRVACCVIALADPDKHAHHTDHVESNQELEHKHDHSDMVKVKFGATNKDSKP